MREKETCKWIGEGEGCSNLCLPKKSYCLRHHIRIYDTYLSEMAEYILDIEISSNHKNTD